MFSPIDSFCGTEYHPESVKGLVYGRGSIDGVNEPIFLKIYVSVIRESPGVGGQTLDDIQAALDDLYQDFVPHNIFFENDCEIIEITDARIKEIDSLNQKIGYNWLSSTLDFFLFNDSLDFNGGASFMHEDGIDIFISPKEETAGQSIAKVPIPSTALWLRGPLNLLDHTLSHEMGHCLGLWHTFHNTHGPPSNNLNLCELVVDDADLYNNMAADTTGDYVRDTPADPNGLWRDTICERNFIEYFNHVLLDTRCYFSPAGAFFQDTSGKEYRPLVDNLMSYNYGNNCDPTFTLGQRDRMRTLIETKLNHVVVSPTNNNLEIPQTITWPNSEYVSGDLIIKSGATLTIDSNIVFSFNSDSKIIIEPNATLKLYGKLTSGCFKSIWKGVEVWGDSTKSQIMIGGVRGQGRLQMYENSIIENAVTAVQLFGPDGAGGQILCGGAKFINNKTGIEFAPFTNFYPWKPTQPARYTANFTGCTFEVNDDFPHIGNLNAHVWMNGVDGIVFSGCTFSNLSSFKANDPLLYGYGIFSNNSRFIVKPLCTTNIRPCNEFKRSEFKDLGYGVHAQGGAKPYEILSTDFTECLVGVRNRGVTGGKLLFNNVKIGEGISTRSLQIRSVGFAFEDDIAGFTCEENSFIGGGVNKIFENNRGIVMDSTGNNYKEIRRCTFESLDHGIFVQGSNFGPDLDGDPSGLLILCNDNTNNSFDIDVANLGSLDWDQGLFDQFLNDYLPAGNTFNETRDININTSNYDTELRYYIWEDAPLTHTPDQVWGLVKNTFKSEENNCEQNYFDSSSNEDNSLNVSQLLQKYDNAKYSLETIEDNTSEQNQNRRKYYKSLMDKFAYQIFELELNDTSNYEQGKVIAALSRFQDYQSELSITDFFIAQNDWNMATQTLSNILDKYTLSDIESADLNDFNYVFNLVTGKDLNNLDSMTLSNLYDLDSIGGNAQTWVRNILTVHGAHYPLEINESEGIEERNSFPTPTFNAIPGVLTVFPNPANDYVRFTIASSKPNLSLIIRDLNGKIVFSNSDFSNNQVNWNLEESPSGIYFYQLINSKELLSAGKIIVNK